MHSRDLFLGLVLVVGAAWIAVTTGAGPDRPTFLVAVLGCGLAGVVYLIGGSEAGAGTVIAGRRITRLRFRAVSQTLLGISMVALGLGGYLADGSIISAVLGGFGVVVIVIARWIWVRGDPSAAPEG